ncbi:hypothetical protein [Bacteriophage sp.]|nr:hypothetical protein [Bacteriophage sp.]
MPRHFGPQCIANGYAAMGNSLRRPRHAGIDSTKSVAQAIAEERARAVRIAKASAKKK